MVVLVRTAAVSVPMCAAVSAPVDMLVVVFESVVTVVVVLVESVVLLLLELSLQAATVAAMAKTAKNFFMLVFEVLLMGAKVEVIPKFPKLSTRA